MEYATPTPDTRRDTDHDRHTSLLEQSMTALETVQQRLLKEHGENLEMLTRSIPRIAAAIVQTVRLHHQISGADDGGLSRLAALFETVDTPDPEHGEKTP